MSRYVLVEIREVFKLRNFGIVVVPHLPHQDFGPTRSWRAFLATPTGHILPCGAVLNLTHFNIPDSADASRRWWLVPQIIGLAQSQLKIGSRLVIEDEAAAKAFGLAVYG
jgi:hypothetical protein